MLIFHHLPSIFYYYFNKLMDFESVHKQTRKQEYIYIFNDTQAPT